MPAADRTLQLIADTLAATEAPMPDQPRTDDRIPLRTTELSTAGLLDHVTRDRDEARTDLGQALAQLTDAWAALNAAGYAHPVASVADLIRQCAADRDAAVSRLNHTRTTAHKLEVERDDLRIQLGRAEGDNRAMMRDRDEVIAERDKARAQLADARADTHRDIARQIRILADDPTVLRWWLDTCDPTPTGFGELLGHLAEKIGRGDTTPSPGSGPTRVHELPALVFNAISRALQDVWPISVPLPVVRERCTAAVLAALDAEPTRAAPEQPGHDDQCTPPLCAACGCWCHGVEQAVAQIAAEAAQHQADVAAGRVDDHLGGPPAGYHITRGAGPTDLEAGCPCGKAPCGSVDTRRTDPACEQHPADRARTMRQMHLADQCPANNPANTREG
ncbi:hypothetical protein [Micromonospora sp. NBC_00421]|uniref:hypothetical protein n=1 Tax=Micromonospora sp. NBC_00421 TaxID=2975976 RepID=UPI002E22E24F